VFRTLRYRQMYRHRRMRSQVLRSAVSG